MKVRFYNTLTKQIEEFAPLDPNGRAVRFYSCGPTVYDYAHIGNFRSFLNADVLRRALELAGYEVRQVMNMTDVGHMTEDDVADGGGQDKMEVAAQRLLDAKKAGTLPAGAKVDPNDPYAIADFYANAFLDDARTLGLKVVRDAQAQPELMPRPTRFIEPMIDMVQALLRRGHAYVAGDGAVYFSVQSYEEYGALSGNTPDRIRSGEGGRVSESTQSVKKHPADFMLWKPDARHLMRWASPWGEGYPGWHLECSVMAIALLGGDTGGVIDIHSGGEDNIFPHHECEIAQACCATGAQHFSRYWFHTRFLIVEGEKMSKSKGNFFTVRDLQARGASPAAIRLELIRTHYRSNANFTMQGLRDSQRAVERWKRLEARFEEVAAGDNEGPLTRALEEFKRAIFNDLNVAGAIGALEAAAGAYRIDDGAGASASRSDLASLRTMLVTLGVGDLDYEAASGVGEEDINWISARLAARNEARAAKDWQEADRIRDELLESGIEIKDSAGETTWSRMVR